MASIGWIDFSRDDRNRVGSVLELFRPEGMVDELGMGTLRDGLSNEMFPGFNSIQTRAKYFFIIPYILHDYLHLPSATRRNKNASQYLEEQEYEVMWDLAEKNNYTDGNGVIGITKHRPNKIVRRPSAIYWNGLNTYKFIDSRGLSADMFLKQCTKPTLESLLSTAQQGDDTPGDDVDAEHENIFKLKVPVKKDWLSDLVLELDKDEAEFFSDRIQSIARDKLVAELLQNEDLWNAFDHASNFMQFATIAHKLNVSDKLKSILIMAHDFSELMYGAHLAYNCQLHRCVFNSNYYDEQWKKWVEELKYRMLSFDTFNPDELFKFAITTKQGTCNFVKNWWEQAKLKFPNIILRDELISNQELQVKKVKARLSWKKFDDIRENGWIGLRHFDYRFFQARVILRDIRNALIN